jgi:hypothetical protein
MFAWNGSRKATRTVSEALSYLRKAETVSIVIVDDGEPVEERAKLGKDRAVRNANEGSSGEPSCH